MKNNKKVYSIFIGLAMLVSVTALFNVLPAYAVTPTSFTSSIYNVTGTFRSHGIAIDNSGIVWWTDLKPPGLIIRQDPSFAPGDPAGITTYGIPSILESPIAIIIGPDGNPWFSANNNYLVKLDPTGPTFTKYLIPDSKCPVDHMAFDASGNLWFACIHSSTIGRLNLPAGTIDMFTTPTNPFSNPSGLTVDYEGKVWAVQIKKDNVVLLDPLVAIPNTSTGLTEFPIPTPPSNPENIKACGNTLWFTEIANNTGSPARIAKVDKITNTITEFVVDPSSQSTYGLAIDGDGNPWATNSNAAFIYGFDTNTNTPLVFTTPTIPHELALSPSGDLWYSDIRGHVVRMIPNVSLSPECNASQIPRTSISTTLSGSSIPIGGSITDSATLSGNTVNAGGSVTYNIYNNTSCTGTPVFTSAVTVTNGAVPSSSAFTPSVAGAYNAQAVYSGDSNNAGSTSTCGSEPFNVPTPNTGRMTGGGSILTPAATSGSGKNSSIRVTHGFELHCDVNQSPNTLEVNWDKGNKFHLDSLTTASCTDDPTIIPNPPDAGFDTYKGTGTGSYNGVSGATAVWTFTDAGEPGKNDFASLVIKDKNNIVVLSVSGYLNSGNQQAHKN